MNIFLIRHGQKIEDNKNHEDLGLTGVGLKQADLLGKRINIISKKSIPVI